VGLILPDGCDRSPVVVTGCGVPRFRVMRVWSGGSVGRQPGEVVRCSSRVLASIATWAQGARTDKCKIVCLAVRAMLIMPRCTDK
jgi:hypothetical protein